MFKILNGYDNFDITILFSLKKDNITRGHEVTLVNEQCRLDIRKYSSNVNMFKNKVDTYLRMMDYT